MPMTTRGKVIDTPGKVVSKAPSGATPSRAAVGKSSKTTSTDVLLFYPNLIGYIRVTCMVLSFYYAVKSWKTSLICYLIAFGGDVIDGYVARKFQQSSKFGGILDMVTDRVSTCGFLVILSHLYPKYTFHMVMLIVLDISSHWFHVMSVSVHHKSEKALENRSVFLKWYYGIYPLFGYCCVGTEIFYVLLYAIHFYPNPVLSKLCFYGCFPACVIKQVVNVVQLTSAAEALAAEDAK